jgi:hypothetical protein
VARPYGIFNGPISASRPSPDGSKVAMLIERPWWRPYIDRNFDLAIKRSWIGMRSIVFTSPDERILGTERFIWSKDSKHVILVGKKFFGMPMLQLRTGETVYLLYDVDDGKIACNSSQAIEYPRITMDELETIEFEEPLELQ